jgi:isopentenyl phosphate kinase
MPRPIILIKLGGSIITNKEVPMTVRQDVLTRLVKEIYVAKKKVDADFIVGHGQGSFGHAPALRYKTMDGFINKDSLMGMAITQDSAAQLNRIVVKSFINEHLPAVSCMFSNMLVTKDTKAEHWCSAVLDQYLEKGLLPISGGDVIVDSSQGCTIWSTEKVLNFIAEQYQAQGRTIQYVIHVTEVDGVLDAQNKVIPQITSETASSAYQLINGTKGFDVTGGMKHKIEESLSLAHSGINSVILSGLIKGNLQNFLLGETFVGTTISR